MRQLTQECRVTVERLTDEEIEKYTKEKRERTCSSNSQKQIIYHAKGKAKSKLKHILQNIEKKVLVSPVHGRTHAKICKYILEKKY